MLRPSTLSTTEFPGTQEKLIRQKTLQELQAEKARFEFMASNNYHYPDDSKKWGKITAAFLTHEKSPDIWHSVKMGIMFILF